jgi:hypothetical protein
MKITAIQFTESEIDVIYNYLTSKFNEENKPQKLEFDLSELKEFKTIDNFQVESVLELYTEWSELDETKYSSIIYRSVVKFRITVFFDGEEIKTNLVDSSIYDKIINYYSK